ncbi:hypothetical protein [Niveispirillum cyanobacteriorum]|nr:hypothetical protein [Niveispirillum cyanobacteriorum]GGE68398.1 hypothetical protein GCM10011317_27060 [Niveispirillum cyanobacteriorum]
MPMPNNTSPRLAESEWRQARTRPGPMQHPAARQSHTNEQGAADLREKEWRAARPTDHVKRKAQVGRT